MNTYFFSRYALLLFFCIALLLSASDVCAQSSIYPSTFFPLNTEHGTQMLVAGSSGQPTRFFAFNRKMYWSEGSMLSSWRSGNSSRKSTNLAGVSILCAGVVDSTSLLAVLQRKDTLMLVRIDSSLTIRQEQFLSTILYDGALRCSLAVSSAGSALLLLGDQLFLCTPFASPFLTHFPGSVETMMALQSSSREQFVYVLREGRNRVAVYTDGQGNMLSRTDIQLPSVDAILSAGTTVAFIRDLAASSEVTLLTRDGMLMRSFIPATIRHITMTQSAPRHFEFHYISMDEEGYGWNVVGLQSGSTSTKELYTMRLPDGFVNPYRVVQEGDRSFILFQNGLVSIDALHHIHSANRFTLPANSDSLWDIHSAGSILLLSHPLGSMVLQEKENSLWWINRLVTHFWLYALILLIVVVMYALFRRMYRQRRLIRTLFEVPEADPVIVLDNEGRVTKFNEQARLLLHVLPGVPMKRMAHSYMAERQVAGLQELIHEAYSGRRMVSKKVTVGNEAEITDYLFTAVPVFNTFRNIQELFLTGRNITEELERKRLANWAQLAHDMQTNLSIIRLNAEKISTSGDDETAERGRKVLFQVSLLINRVRDLVTIGRNDTLEKQLVDVADICADVAREFDQSLFAHVTFRIEAKHIFLPCDKLKLERALRNAVENGIRALQGNFGFIEISSWFDRKYVFFQVTDSGVGMDKETQDNMMKPFFTTSGTQGGTGMGTMIMRHVVHQHGGEIFVQSEKGKGTSIQFRLPNIGTYFPHLDTNSEYSQKVGVHE